MSATIISDLSAFDARHPDWRIVIGHGCNALIEGAPAATDAAVGLLRSHVREPMVRLDARNPLNLDAVADGRLALVTDAAHLSARDQVRLLGWMGADGARTRIISTTARPLYALVANGRFSADLYYRLNVVLLRVAERRVPGNAEEPYPATRVRRPDTPQPQGSRSRSVIAPVDQRPVSGGS
jgi:hypothetical protein